MMHPMKGVDLAKEAAHRHWQRVYGFARNRGLCHEDAEDLAQDTFLTLVSRPPKRHLRRLELWSVVFLVGRRSLNSTWRRQLAGKRAYYRKVPLSSADCLTGPPDPGFPKPECSCESFLASLRDEGYGNLVNVLWRWLNGETYKDIARNLQITRGKVTNSLHRARVLLRRMEPARAWQGED